MIGSNGQTCILTKHHLYIWNSGVMYSLQGLDKLQLDKNLVRKGRIKKRNQKTKETRHRSTVY